MSLLYFSYYTFEILQNSPRETQVWNSFTHQSNSKMVNIIGLNTI